MLSGWLLARMINSTTVMPYVGRRTVTMARLWRVGVMLRARGITLEFNMVLD